MLLAEVARRMKACVRDVNVVARLGRDEFVVVVEELAGAEELDRLARRITDMVRQPVDELIDAADDAMYDAERTHAARWSATYGGCRTHRGAAPDEGTPPRSAERTDASITAVPDRFADLLAANARFADAFPFADLDAPPRRRLAVLTCIDTRIDPLRVLGLEVGDAKVLRNAGARVTPDVVRSLAVAVHVLRVDAVAVMQHTECGLAGRTDGELRAVLRDSGCDWPADQPLLALDDADAALHSDVSALAASPYLGGADVAGFRYDVRSGRVHRLV